MLKEKFIIKKEIEYFKSSATNGHKTITIESDNLLETECQKIGSKELVKMLNKNDNLYLCECNVVNNYVDRYTIFYQINDTNDREYCTIAIFGTLE